MCDRLQEGHSVLARVAGFFPYFYVEAPHGFSEDHLQELLDYLNVLVLRFILSTLVNPLYL